MCIRDRSYIKTQIPNDFPSVKELKYNIKAINDEIASSSGVAAYFNIPPPVSYTHLDVYKRQTSSSVFAS